MAAIFLLPPVELGTCDAVAHTYLSPLTQNNDGITAIVTMASHRQDLQQQLSAECTAAPPAAGTSSDGSSTDGGRSLSVADLPDFRQSVTAQGPSQTQSSTGIKQGQRAEGLEAFKDLEQSLEPARDLADVSHRLKKLEKAVKSHLLGSRVAGDASILSSSSGGQQTGSATFGSPMPQRLSERAQLRSTLSAIKADVADLAAKEVEAQLLQQRVARLEAAIGGLTVAPGFASGLTSFAGSVLGGPTLVPAGLGQRLDASPRITRTPSGGPLDMRTP